MRSLPSKGLVGSALAFLGATFLYSQQPSPAERQAALVKRACVGCHNNNAKTGGLTLEPLDIRHPADGGEAALEVWEKVVRKVRVGMMPPRGAPKITDDERSGLISFLEGELDRAAAARPS
ncbi:MAG: hypothetical protein RL328_2201, partial [Acidobacteriota bacterium]